MFFTTLVFHNKRSIFNLVKELLANQGPGFTASLSSLRRFGVQFFSLNSGPYDLEVVLIEIVV